MARIHTSFALTMSFTVAIACGCRFPFPEDVPDPTDAPDGYGVGGEAVGLWTGANLVVRLEPVGMPAQTVSVTGEGRFWFNQRYPSGTSFTVSIETQPARHTCSVQNGSGRVEGADFVGLAIGCTADISVSISLSSPIRFHFDHNTSRYELPVSLVQGSVSVSVDGSPDTRARVGAMPLDLGVSSPPIELVYGRNELLIDFTVGELSRGYQIALDRGAATPTEYTYAKPVIRIAEVRFGQVLAVSGDRVAVGAEDNSSVGNPTVPNNNAPNSGVVYVLRRGGEEWVHDGYLKGTSIRAGQRLGASVDMDGSVIVAGTQCEDNGLVGSVHVFRRGATTWVEEQRITRTNATPDDGFGRAVAVHGDVVAVNSEFGVHIYRRVDGVWTEEATLTIPGRFGFGRRIVLHADVAIIADPYDSSSQTGISTSAATDAGRPYSGAVYVYRRVNSMWTLEAYIKASNPDGADLFGFSIAFDGQVLVVGAPEERSGDGNQQDNSVAYAGAAYVFQRGASAWSQVAYLKSATPQRADAFGAAVAVRGDTLVAGAHESGDLGSTPGRKGTVHLFRRIAGLWTRAPILQASNREDGDFFGGAVALSRDGLVVGAMYEDGRATPMDNDASGNGAVYVFR